MVQAENGPKTNVYRGISFSVRPELHTRDVALYESSWKEGMEVPSFDTLLSSQLEKAVKKDHTRGRKITVVVFDLGGGKNHFIKQFLSDESVGQKSRALLQRNPNLHLLLASITDAEADAEFLQPQSITPNDPITPIDNSSITAVSIPYSVTSSQSIGRLFQDNALEDMGIDGINLAVSVGFLTYLTPRVFKGVMNDLIDNLEEGGEMVLFDYANMAGSSLSLDDDRVTEDEPVIFRNVHDPFDPGVRSDELRAQAEELLTQEGVEDSILLAMKQKIITTLVKSEAFDGHRLLGSPEILEITNAKDLLRYFIDVWLTEGENILRIEQVKEEKQEILQQLQERGDALVEYNNTTIRVRKD